MKTRTIEPPSAREETLTVIRAATAIAVLAAIAISAESTGARSADSGLFTFQKLFRDLPPADQRVFRQLQEGLLEAESIRASTGRWPSVEELAAQGIPPFAPDPIAPRAFTWSARFADRTANYLGTPGTAPDGGRGNDFLLLVQEPGETAAPPNAPSAPLDEFHHRLGDTLIHVSIWMHDAKDPLPDQIVDRPIERGFTQLLAGAPKETKERKPSP